MSERPPVVARVSRQLAAAPERVFDAWLDPAMIGHWMFGPAVRDEEVVRIALDPRVGGAFSFVVRRQGDEIEHVGRYLELDRPRRLAFSWAVAPAAADSRVAADIVASGTGSAVTLAHHLHPAWADFRPRTEEAWGKMLDALAAALQGG
jgi:uncharacterized protein YndB with AHSA1/START domain